MKAPPWAGDLAWGTALVVTFLAAASATRAALDCGNHAADEQMGHLPSVLKLWWHWPALDLAEDWTLAMRLPTVAERSVLFLALAPVGGALAAACWREQRRVDPAAADAWLAAFGTWLASAAVQRQVFHRYFEPAALAFILLAWPRLVRAARGHNLPAEDR